MPSAGSASADVGTSLLRLGGLVALFAATAALVALLLRWVTGELQLNRLARRRLREEPPPAVAPAPRPAGSADRRPAAAGHHPVGRRVPGTRSTPTPPPTPRPRRPLQLVAADVRRLTRELSMVPGGMPMARRRGLLAAYDDVLIEAAELLEVPHQLTSAPPANRELERLRLIASLEAAGLVVAG
ncbi:hypothetical protein [Modestobacter altitudinis]|uniref:hypothetical protein n=1 Tax=Modestobacter altitudinis TaxID=2213158 RepID=UPI00110D1AB7|nr:hypothetical protein [Modestobacter altitudinis]